MSNHSHIIYPLQYLRGIAACWVMLFHYTGSFTADSPIEDALLFIAKQGFFGVDLFFVISGFISAYSFSHQPCTVSRFMQRRVLRIFLGYWPVLLLFWGILILSGHDMQPYHIWRSFFLIPQSLLHNPLMIVWTLYHELIFYGLFALAMKMFPEARKHITFLAACGMVAMFTYYALNGHYNTVEAWWPLWTHQADWLAYTVTPYLLEFICGIYLFHCKITLRPRAILLLAIIALTIACAINALLFNHQLHDGYREFYRVLIALPFAALFVLTAIRWKPHPPVRWLAETGNMSFSLYLLHLPLLYVAQWLYDDRLLIISSNSVHLIAMCCITICLSWVWYKYIEYKLYTLTKGKNNSLVICIYVTPPYCMNNDTWINHLDKTPY